MSNADRVVHRHDLDALIAEVAATIDCTELVGRLEAAGIAYAVQRTMAEFSAHPQ